MKVIILCGGFGTRLSEETKTKPKPMIKIGKFPIVEHIMHIYNRYGFNNFILAKLNAKVYFINKPLGYQRFHKNSASSNIKKHLISTKLLLKHHVFNIQDFTLNKQQLWSEVKSFIEFKKILFNKKKKFFMFLIYFFNNPFFCIKYSLSLFIKKIKDYLIYYFYKRELDELKKL